MISKDHITGIVQEQLTEDDFIVEITIDSHNKISISIDNKSGISIDRCVKISRHVERNLDRDIEDFELVVSSPGLDSEFKVPEQYEKNLGKEISVQKKSGEKLTGKLLEFTGEKITLEEKKKIKVGKKKKEVLENTDIYINEINKVKAVISFK
ncbi:MAG: ribosome assembly cofactor RimP [Bacteroidota bacterium]